MIKTAIIMVTYNGWSLTEACLNDLMPLVESGDFVIAIADNASTDGTIEKLHSQFPLVHVYPLSKNLGFGKANNEAIRGLLNDGIEFNTICLLNNDTRLEPQAIKNLKQAFDKAQDDYGKVVVSPMVVNSDRTPQHNYFAGLGPMGIGSFAFLMNAIRSEQAAAKILEGTPTPVGDFCETCWTSAVCWMLSAQLWQQTNGFDEKIFMYYEDADLALRLINLGAKFLLVNQATITHLGGGSAKSNLSRALQHDRSQEYVFKKHFGLRGWTLSKTFRALRSLVRIMVVFPKSLIPGNKDKRDYVKIHLALFKEALL